MKKKTKKKVLVTGSSGFLGSNLVDFLKKKNFDVVLFDNKPSQFKSKNDREFLGSLLDKNLIRKALKGCDAIFHFAAISDIDFSIKNPSETIQTNVVGTINIIEEALKQKIHRFIYASTIYIYSDKGSFYRVSKSSSEEIIYEYAKNSKLLPTVLRFGSLYGPRAPKTNLITKSILNAINKKEIIFYSKGEEIREYIHVYDAVNLTIKTLDSKYINKNLIISGKEKFRIKDMMKIITEIFEKKIKLKFIQSKKFSNHYEITPFIHKSNFAKKISLDESIDFGQGVLDMINKLDNR